MSFKNILSTLPVAITICCLTACSKSDSTPPITHRTYFPQVRTIIQNNCIGCHSPGGIGMPVVLNTDTLIVQYAAAIKAAVNDPVSPTNHRMPLGGTLPDADITTIVNWYNAGGISTISGIKK